MPELWYAVPTWKRKAPSYTGRKEEENRSAKTQIIETKHIVISKKYNANKDSNTTYAQ